MNLLDRFQRWKDKRFLRKQGFDNWEQYHRHHDPRLNKRAPSIKRFYHGYPYVHAFTNVNSDPWIAYGDWLTGLSHIKDWCKDHCKGAWRYDIHRVMDTAYPPSKDWNFNEFGGDYLFFAFENEKDFVWFSLRWSP